MSSAPNTRKKVDPRLRRLLEHGVAKNRRSLLVLVGDRARDQLPNLHFMLQRISSEDSNLSSDLNGSSTNEGSAGVDSTTSTISNNRRLPLLWCYKKELGFSSNKKVRSKLQKKKQNSASYDPNIEDPFDMFVSSNDIKYVYYKDSENVLGKTHGMCILQDFEALTPNILCRTVETVAGGGVVVLLLKTMGSLKQLYSTVMDYHGSLKGSNKESKSNLNDVEPRFSKRLILSMTDCDACLVLDDELNVLPISDNLAVKDELSSSKNSTTAVTTPSESEVKLLKDKRELISLKQDLKKMQPLGCLLHQTKTLDQAKVLMSFVDVISEKSLKQTVSLTAGRGRGKSAALGLALASSLAYGYSNIFVTAPSPENLTTVFEFLLVGFDALGYKEHDDYELLQSDDPDLKKCIVRVNVFKHHRQTVQYIAPEDSKSLSQAELLVVDEAAAIPLPLVRKLIGPYVVFLSSTVSGYEGTGRSLSLKLISEMRSQQNAGGDQAVSVGHSAGAASSENKKLADGSHLRGRSLTELVLNEPIRYGRGDNLETWLNQLCCLDASDSIKQSPLKCGFPIPKDCELLLIDRDFLFSYSDKSEKFLKKLMGLFVSSHYKNSPNDLLLLSDAPGHFIFCLTDKNGADTNTNKDPDILVAIHLATEGSLQKHAVQTALARGLRPSGDMISWTIAQYFSDEAFACLKGARIVRIATHPNVGRKGYGGEAVKQIIGWFEGKMAPVGGYCSEGEEEDKSVTTVDNIKNLSLGSRLSETRPPFFLDYLGTSFGLTAQLLRFWGKSAFVPVWLKSLKNDTTGEHSCILIRKCNSNSGSDNDSHSATWLPEFNLDFRSRFQRQLGGSFKDLPLDLAMSILDLRTRPSVSNLKGNSEAQKEAKLLTLKDSLNHFSRHDLHRLERYANNRADFSLLLDLIPVLANLYFSNRLPTSAAFSPLTPVQSAILLGLGLQHRSVDDLCKELGLPVSQVLALFTKGLHKLWGFFSKQLEGDADSSEGLECPGSEHPPLPVTTTKPTANAAALLKEQADFGKQALKGLQTQPEVGQRICVKREVKPGDAEWDRVDKRGDAEMKRRKTENKTSSKKKH